MMSLLIFSYSRVGTLMVSTMTFFTCASGFINLSKMAGFVVPFVPIEGVTMADCVALARKVGAALAERHGLPVYLYEDAASSPARARRAS